MKEVKDSLPEFAEDDKEFHSKNTVIGVNGYWYDVENFIPKHPGGPIIKQYIGADVTSSFYGMHRHPDEILRRRTPVAKVKFDEEKIRNKDINEDYWNLWHRYKEIGLFEPNLPWLIRGLACIAINVITAVFSVTHYSDSTVFNGILIGNIFTMSGFMLHDSMHRLVHKDTKTCYLLGWLCGNIGFGVSSNWWRNEHDPHHAAPNTWDRIQERVFDDQAYQPEWCQDDVLFDFFQSFKSAFFIRNQHWCIIALPLFFSKIAINIASYRRPLEKSLFQWCGGLIHYFWVFMILRQLDHPFLGACIAFWT